jgi:hypothetical protein
MGIRAKRDTKRSRKAEICEFEIAAGVDEQILWFEVTVENAVGVAIVQS